jgi:hypothetical protein
LRRLSPAQRWAIIVALGALLVAAIDIWWFDTYRAGFPFDIDEAGYTAFGLADHLGGQANGVKGWWDSIQGQPTFAPLVPALTSLTLYVHTGLLNGFAVLAAFAVVLAMASYGIGQRLTGARLGAFAALVVATLPGTFFFAREYIYALPSAALLSCAVFALLRSDGLRARRWAIACGAAIGLLLLARTMTIGFVPGLLLAALVVLVLRAGDDLRARLVNFGLLILVAIAVAATWYARNLVSVYHYLTGYGYGNQAKNYGEQHALVSWGRLRGPGERLIVENLFLPLALLVLAGLIALGVIAVKKLIPAETRRAVAKRLASSDAFSVTLVFVVGYAALMSSQNSGNGFTIPLAVLLPPLAVMALRRFPAMAAPTVGLVAVIAVVNVVSTATIWSTASHPRLLSVPLLHAGLPITSGMPVAVDNIRQQVPGPRTVFDDSDKRWLQADDRVADLLVDELAGPYGELPPVAFASRNHVLNTNTVQVRLLMRYQRAIAFTQLLAEPRNSVANYVDEMTDPKLGIPTALVTMNTERGDYTPRVSQAKAESAGKRLGFHKIREITLPDGRRLRLWVKQAPGSAAPTAKPAFQSTEP